MANVKKIARRSLLVGSVAIAGGVAFGYYAVKQPHKNPLTDDIEKGEATFNPWVKISAEKITLIAPHADVGQGVMSMQAMLIAEELDVEFGQFDVSFGEPSPAYYNTAIAAEAVPFLSTDKSIQAEAMRSVMGAAFKMLGLQATGGSSAVPDSFEKLRLAGAVARETLKKAASKQSRIPVRELRTEKGAVILPDGTPIPYTDLAARAAKIRPVANIDLRPPSAWRLVGRPVQRLDVVAKSTGALKYGIDLKFDGMVYAAVRHNPRKGGALNGFDASAAKKMRGVQKIIPLEAGVAVIADNTWRAIRAANAINFDWGPAPYPAEMDDHWTALSNSFTDDYLDKTWRNDGDVDEILSDSETVEAEYRAPYLAHAPLEPISAIVKVTDDGAEVWTGTQFQRFVQTNVAEIVGCKAEAVTLHNQFMGGSFGHRLEDEQIKQATRIAMAMKGTPVKLTYSREEDFAQDFTRQIAMGRMRGAVKDGRVVACDLSIAMPSVQDSQFSRQPMSVPPGPDSQIAAGAWNLPYNIPHFRMNAYRAAPLAPISSWRSVGASSNGFFADCAIDELIHAAGADPLEERLRLVNTDGARKVLEAVGEMANWGADPGPRRGRGVALVESFGVPVAEIIDVTETDDGIKIDKVFVALDVGRIVDPVNFDNHVKGAVVWGLGHAMNCEIVYSDGKAQQSNYHHYEGMRLYQCPDIVVRGLENADQIRGVGEPPVPPAAAALANAIFAATGKRLREMPFNKHVEFA